MKPFKIILILSLVLLAIVSFYAFRTFSNDAGTANSQAVDTVFIGPEKYANTFSKSLKSAGDFFDLYREAGKYVESQNYDDAIRLYNESLRYVKFGPEKAMVYSELVDIYRALGDLEAELKYAELLPQYTANPRRRREFERRAAEIRAQLAAKKQANQRKPGSDPAGATQPR